jgi:hypothetical protein
MNKSITPLGDNALKILQVQAENLHYLMNQAYEAIERVRELHKPIEEVNENGFVNIVCNGCFDEEPSTGQEFHHDYPCPTVQALNGTSNEA